MRQKLADLWNRVRPNTPNQPTMSYMIRGNSIDDTDPWKDTPFTPTARLESRTTDSLHEYVRRGATRVYEELNRRGELSEVRTSWFEPEQTCYRAGSAGAFYKIEVAPVVATADDVTWNSAFRMDLDAAPAHKSEEWKDIASDFRLSERDAERGIPSSVSCAYSHLETLTERDDGDRAVSPEELRNNGPRVSDRAFDQVVELLATFPGVDAPDDDAPVWELSDESAAKSTTSGETGEEPSHV
jgi:hypothetical protein